MTARPAGGKGEAVARHSAPLGWGDDGEPGPAEATRFSQCRTPSFASHCLVARNLPYLDPVRTSRSHVHLGTVTVL